MQRPTVIMFENGIPSKAHCSCPVGLSGICCHVLALLLFLKHYHETGERILALTSTEQLQKWHRCSHKSSIPMVPLPQPVGSNSHSYVCMWKDTLKQCVLCRDTKRG